MSAQGSPAAGTALDPERLKYVTENFAALQGLNFVAVGSVLFLLEIENIWNVPGLVPLIAALGLLLTMYHIPKYYDRRFGRVEAKPPTNWQALIFVAVIVVLLIWGRRFEVILSDLEHRIHLMISDPTGQANLFPFALWIFAFYISLRRHRRVDQYGPYFFGFGMIACLVVAVYPLWDPGTRQLTVWRTLNAGSGGLSLIAWGFYNHFTLVRLLPRISAESQDER